MKSLVLGLLCCAAVAGPAFADDGSAALSAGGIVFVKSADIRMATEDLYLSPEKVRVRFAFSNDSGRDQDVLIAFPLPDLDLEEFQNSEIGTIGSDPVNFVGFTATVDGRKVAFQVEQKAMLKGRDISAAIRAAGLPLNLAVGNGYQKLEKLTPAQKTALANAGAIDTSESYVVALWTVQTRFYWTQHFAAGATLAIEHTYTPVTGGAQYYDNKDTGGPPQDDFVKPYCMDKATIARQKAMLADPRQRPGMAKDLPGNMLLASETSYILKSANSWKGPIGRFHMTLDKLDPRATLNLCWSGTLKKTSPTTFEFSAADFTPTQDVSMVVLR